MNRHSRKLFSWTVITGLIFNLLSPLFLLPWQKVWACFGAWDCDGNSYCAGAGSYPDHPGSCASYGERGNNDRTTSEIAQDYINSGGNPAEVVTRTSDFQGRSSNDDAAAAAAKAQELAVAEAQRIAAEQAAAAKAAADAAAAKEADNKAKAEAQRLAQEAAERAARAEANAAAAATAMTAINPAVPAGTPEVGATTAPAAAAPAAAEAACGSSKHNSCSPNSDGNWYRCNNGSWQSAPDCKPAGAINCVSGCAGANGCVDEGKTGGQYAGNVMVCDKGKWIPQGTDQPTISQKPENLAEKIDEAWEAQYINPPIVIKPSATPTTKPMTTAAPTTAAQPPAVPATPTQQNAQQVLESIRCGERGGTWTNDNTCQSPGRPSPTIAPNPTAAMGPFQPTPTPTVASIPPVEPDDTKGSGRLSRGMAMPVPLITAAPTKIPNFFTPPDRNSREDRAQTAAPEICRPGIGRNPDGSCAETDSLVLLDQYRCGERGGEWIKGGCRTEVKTETEAVRLGGGKFGQEVTVTTKTFCAGDSVVTQTRRSDGTESSSSTACDWGCSGGACRGPTPQETQAYRYSVLQNAIDREQIACQQEVGGDDRDAGRQCNNETIYQRAINNLQVGEPAPVYTEIFNQAGRSDTVRQAISDDKYEELVRQNTGRGRSGGVPLTEEQKAELRQQADEYAEEVVNTGSLSATGYNTLNADSQVWDKISNVSAEEAKRLVDQQGWGGGIIAKNLFCAVNNNYRAAGECGYQQVGARSDENIESGQGFWSFLVAGKSEQKLWDQGMIFGDPRSAGYQARELEDKVAPACGVHIWQSSVTKEERVCLTGQSVAAKARIAEVDEQNAQMAALNIGSVALGFVGGAVGAGIKGAGLAAQAGRVVVGSGAIPDAIVAVGMAEAMTAGDRAAAEVVEAMSKAEGISATERQTWSRQAEELTVQADEAYNQNLLYGVAFAAVGDVAGEVGLPVIGRGLRDSLRDAAEAVHLGGVADVLFGAKPGRLAAEAAEDLANVTPFRDSRGTLWAPSGGTRPAREVLSGDLWTSAAVFEVGADGSLGRVSTNVDRVLAGVDNGSLREGSMVAVVGQDGNPRLFRYGGDENLTEWSPAGKTAPVSAVADLAGARVVTPDEVAAAAGNVRAALGGDTPAVLGSGEPMVVIGGDKPLLPAAGEVAEAVDNWPILAGRETTGNLFDRAGQTVGDAVDQLAEVPAAVGNAVGGAAAEIWNAAENIGEALPFGRKPGLDLEGPPASAAKTIGEAFPEAGSVEVVPKGGREPYRVDYDPNNPQAFDSLRPGDTVDDVNGRGWIKNEDGTWSSLGEEVGGGGEGGSTVSISESEEIQPEKLDIIVGSESPIRVPGTVGTEISLSGKTAIKIGRDKADSVVVNGKLIRSPYSLYDGDEVIINGIRAEVKMTPSGLRITSAGEIAPLPKPLESFQPISKPQFDAENALAMSRDSFDQLDRTEQTGLMNKLDIQVEKPNAEMMQQGKENIRGIFGKDDWRITTAGDLKKAGLEPKYKIEIDGVTSSGQSANTTFHFSDVFESPDGRLYAIGYSGEPPSPKVFYKSNSHGNWRVAPDAILHLKDKGYNIIFGKGNIPELGVQEEFATTIATELQTALSDLAKSPKKVKNANSLAFGLLNLDKASDQSSSLAENIRIESLFERDPKTGKRIFKDPGYEPDYSRVVYEYDSTACPPGLTCSGKAVVFASKDGQIHYTYFYDPASGRVWPLSVGSSNSPVNELGTRSLYFDSGDYFIDSPYEYRDIVEQDFDMKQYARPVPKANQYYDVYGYIERKPHIREAKAAIQQTVGETIPAGKAKGLAGFLQRTKDVLNGFASKGEVVNIPYPDKVSQLAGENVPIVKTFTDRWPQVTKDLESELRKGATLNEAVETVMSKLRRGGSYEISLNDGQIDHYFRPDVENAAKSIDEQLRGGGRSSSGLGIVAPGFREGELFGPNGPAVKASKAVGETISSIGGDINARFSKGSSLDDLVGPTGVIHNSEFLADVRPDPGLENTVRARPETGYTNQLKAYLEENPVKFGLDADGNRIPLGAEDAAKLREASLRGLRPDEIPAIVVTPEGDGQKLRLEDLFECNPLSLRFQFIPRVFATGRGPCQISAHPNSTIRRPNGVVEEFSTTEDIGGGGFGRVARTGPGEFSKIAHDAERAQYLIAEKRWLENADRLGFGDILPKVTGDIYDESGQFIGFTMTEIENAVTLSQWPFLIPERVLRPFIDRLAELDNLGLFHRDIFPKNVMVVLEPAPVEKGFRVRKLVLIDPIEPTGENISHLFLDSRFPLAKSYSETGFYETRLAGGSLQVIVPKDNVDAGKALIDQHNFTVAHAEYSQVRNPLPEEELRGIANHEVSSKYGLIPADELPTTDGQSITRDDYARIKNKSGTGLERTTDDLMDALDISCNPVIGFRITPQAYAGSRDPCPITLFGPNGPAAKASKAVKDFFGGEELPVRTISPADENIAETIQPFFRTPLSDSPQSTVGRIDNGTTFAATIGSPDSPRGLLLESKTTGLVTIKPRVGEELSAGEVTTIVRDLKKSHSEGFAVTRETQLKYGDILKKEGFVGDGQGRLTWIPAENRPGFLSTPRGYKAVKAADEAGHYIIVNNKGENGTELWFDSNSGRILRIENVSSDAELAQAVSLVTKDVQRSVEVYPGLLKDRPDAADMLLNNGFVEISRGRLLFNPQLTKPPTGVRLVAAGLGVMAGLVAGKDYYLPSNKLVETKDFETSRIGSDKIPEVKPEELQIGETVSVPEAHQETICNPQTGILEVNRFGWEETGELCFINDPSINQYFADSEAYLDAEQEARSLMVPAVTIEPESTVESTNNGDNAVIGNGELLLGENFSPGNLAMIANYDGIVVRSLDVSLQSSTIPYLQSFFNEAARRGYTLVVAYGYRSYETQAELHAINPIGAAPAGRSQHQTGIAFDIFWIENGDWNNVKGVPRELMDLAPQYGIVHPLPWDTPHFVVLDAVYPGATRDMIGKGIDPSQSNAYVNDLLESVYGSGQTGINVESEQASTH